MNSKSNEAEGVKVLGNREKGGEKQGMNCYPLYIRAGGLIYASDRQTPIFNPDWTLGLC